eukprot:CAMPEP_0113685846 /NCGR_PEP_ID=MMETSP0038_2-20120614/14926_1 /TAXON_ID=2898 /ORGANISM="Cryptomonas paramecium" /LENGTH=143 /DNA_ID=CAMNT_0000606033 /DNA_START=193 /DNA_END=621 /DNA_ORIENTATION=+ /assembly_acc=CAM_ASM_000170
MDEEEYVDHFVEAVKSNENFGEVLRTLHTDPGFCGFLFGRSCPSLEAHQKLVHHSQVSPSVRRGRARLVAEHPPKYTGLGVHLDPTWVESGLPMTTSDASFDDPRRAGVLFTQAARLSRSAGSFHSALHPAARRHGTAPAGAS